MSGYFIYFYVLGKEEFREGTKFEEMYNLYKFDTELRKLFTQLTEEIEINFRTYIAYYIAHNFGEDGHLNKDNFYNEDYHNEFVQILDKKIESYKDKAYIKHHKNIYNGNMPIWVAVEILSFTDLSKLYSNMKNSDREKIIYNNYEDRDVVKNAGIVRFWIQSLSEIRNRCAHYERLHDGKLKKEIKLPKQYKSTGIRTNSLFSSLIIFKILINDELLWNNFIDEFEKIVFKYEFKNFHNMGFIKGWKSILTGKKTR
ncbi:MAG: Abi family protein [Terrisporobacter othiniensis]|nr:Abi family protein [Terrisporobacter othiniensis]MDU6995374.1 Abi family protein [Terrisporobacter othiniensis]